MKGLGVPDYVVHICAVLREAGCEAYVVGGGVRDALLGRIPKDWDVATDAAPEKVVQLFPRTVPTGVKFGTVSVLVEKPGRDGYIEVEVTTFRGESGYADGRHPDEVRFLARIEDDLVRRDFTVNAIAYDPGTGEIVDPYFGRADLERRVLRAVGDPDARFQEDGLRVLRAVRLATELGFDIHPLTGDALRRNAGCLQPISRERVGEEWRRIAASSAAGRGLHLLHKYELLPYVFAGEHDIGRIEVAARALTRVHEAAAERGASDADRMTAATAVAVYALGPSTLHRRWLLDLVYAKRTIRAVLAVLEFIAAAEAQAAPADGTWRRLLGKLGREHVSALALTWRGLRPMQSDEDAIARIEQLAASGDALTAGELAIDGHDIQCILNIPGSAAVGEMLEHLLEHVLAHPEDNTEGRLAAMVKARYGSRYEKSENPPPGTRSLSRGS